MHKIKITAIRKADYKDLQQKYESIMADNKVLVKAPYGTTERMVQEFLVAKKGWITKHLEKQNREVEQEESLFFFTEDEVKNIKRKARKIIPERVGYWAEKIGVTYGRIAIRLQSSRWGSCAAKLIKPVFDEFHEWLLEIKPKVPPTLMFGRAINYALSAWNHLLNYLDCPELFVDNSIAERSIKPFVIGRKELAFLRI